MDHSDDTHLTMEQRLRRLESIEAIKQLKHRYLRACDNQDPAAVRGCYAEGDIELDFGRVGSFRSRDELAKTFSNLACQPHIIEMHHAQNPEITLQTALKGSLWRLAWQLHGHVTAQNGQGGSPQRPGLLQAGHLGIVVAQNLLEHVFVVDAEVGGGGGRFGLGPGEAQTAAFDRHFAEVPMRGA